MMKRHVEEIASDARTLEEKLNQLPPELALEMIVWANGKLFVVLREYSARPKETLEQPSKDESPWHPPEKSGGNRESRLPKPGARIRKDVQ